MNITREQFTSPNAPRVRKVTLTAPGFAGDAYVRGLTIGQRDRYEGACLKEKSVKGRLFQSVNTENMRARLLVLCLCDESGTALFEETQADMDMVARWPASVGEPLFEAAREESGMSERDLEELKGN